MSRRKPPTMSPETEAVVDIWTPQAMRSKDPDELAAVMPTARTAVAKTAPSSPTEAKRQLRALVPMLLDEHRLRGSVDLRNVLVPNKVEQHAISSLKDMGPGWCQDTRGLLGRIGRANNPQGWPRPPKRLGAKNVSEPGQTGPLQQPLPAKGVGTLHRRGAAFPSESPMGCHSHRGVGS